MRSSYSDTGIVIRSLDSGEADRFVTILSMEHGLADFLARGTRRLTSRKAPHLDPLNRIKFQVSRGDNPRFLEQAESDKYYPQIKKDFQKTSLCLRMAEILLGTLPKEVEDKEMFLSFSNFLNALEVADGHQQIKQLENQFGLFLLRHLGYPAPKESKNQDITTYFETIMNKKIISSQLK